MTDSRVVQRGQGQLGGGGAAERTEVGRAVVQHLADQGQPGERLDGELEPAGLLGELGTPVVARPVLGDQPQLADLGLQLGGADHRVDLLGQRDHLGHPGAHLAGGEVLTDPDPQVDALADVEHRAARVAEQVDPGAGRQGVGEMALAALRRGDLGGEGAQLLQAVHPDSAEPGDQPVQHVHGGPRVRQRPVVGGHLGTEKPCQAGELAVRRLVTGQHPAGQPDGVQAVVARPDHAGLLAGRPQEPQVERGVVRHQHGVAGELQERRQHAGDARGVGHHGVGDPGQHRDEGRDGGLRVDQRLELAEHHAAADLDGADLGDRAGQRGAAGGLQVDHHEGDLAQRGAELVEGRLERDGRNGRRHDRRR